MSNLKKRKRSVSDEALEICRAMYMEHTPLSQIAREMSVPRSTLQYYENSIWRDERNLVSRELLSAMSANRLGSLHGLNDGGIKVLSRAIQSLVTRKDPPSTKEAVDVIKILEVLDKMSDVSNRPQEEEPIPVDFVNIDPFGEEENNDK